MSDIPAALADHLANRVTTLCHCWRLTRRDGATLGFTDHDRTLSFDATSFEPRAGFTASEARASLGLVTDTMDVEGALSSLDIDEDDIEAGTYDRARVETFLVNWRDVEARTLLSVAVVGKLTRRDGAFVAELESLAESLDRPNGRYVRRGCDAELGDARCGVGLGSSEYSGSGAVVSVQGSDRLIVTGLDGFANDWFAQGVLTWTSGAASGRTERVKSFRHTASGTVLALWRESRITAEAGDAFTVTAGCDKSFATCKAKFGNALNFRGFPHLPGNDAAYSYATEDGVFDGSPLVP